MRNAMCSRSRAALLGGGLGEGNPPPERRTVEKIVIFVAKLFKPPIFPAT